MAFQNGPVYISGMTKDGVVFYKSKGKFLTRTKPGRGGVRQTERTKASAQLFGRSSTQAKLVYEAFKPIIQAYSYNRKMFGRMRSRMNMVLGNHCDFRLVSGPEFKRLHGFRFNERGLLPNILRRNGLCSKSADNIVICELPEMNPLRDMRYPGGTSAIEILFMAMGFDFESKTIISQSQEKLTYPVADVRIPRASFEFQRSGVFIIAMQMSFLDQQGELITGMKVGDFECSEIVGVFENK